MQSFLIWNSWRGRGVDMLVKCVGNFLRLRTRVLVNFPGYDCLCSNLDGVKDTSPQPEPEEGVVAS